MNSSHKEKLKLGESVNEAISSPSSSMEDGSDSAPCGELPPPPVQRIGAFSIPLQGWSLLRVDEPDAVVLYVAGEQLRVRVAGRWEPEEPERYLRNPPEPPQPQPGETYIAYAQRYLVWSQPAQTNREWMKWQARRQWVGQSVDELRTLIESDISVPNPCFLVKT
jgi:hypothetical protein